MGDFKSVKRNCANLWMYVVFVAYVAILFITIFRHEPWGDETQAWLLARDSGVKDLFVRYLRYEGAPGLWQLILMIPAKLHFPVFTMQVISGIFACLGVFIFLRYAPFPKIIKAIFPFTFLILYQYAAVARAYVMFPVLFFLLAILFPARRKKPYIFMLLLVLIACVSLHGTVIAIGILMAHYLEIVKDRKALSTKEMREQIISAVFFFALLVSFIFILWVPKDYYRHTHLFKISPLDDLSKTIIIFSDVLLTNLYYSKHISVFAIVMFAISMLTWFISFKQAKHRHLQNYFIFPLTGLALLLNVIILSPWHSGLLFIYWIFLLWICVDGTPKEPFKYKWESKQVILGFMTLVLLMQCYWSYCSVRFDWHYSYSGGKAFANYIKVNHLENKKIYTQYTYSTAFLAYFDRNIVANALDPSQTFVEWSDKKCSYSLPAIQVISDQPDYIVIRSLKIRGNYRIRDFVNYRFVGIFNGGIYWKDRIYHEETFLLFKKMKTIEKAKISIKELNEIVDLMGIDFHPQYLEKNSGPVIGSM